MCDPPPAKRLKQTSIFDALKKQGSLKENIHQTDTDKKEDKEVAAEADRSDTMFGGDDPVKSFQTYRNANRDQTAAAAEKRRTSPRKAAQQKEDAKVTDSRESDVPDGSSEPSTSGHRATEPGSQNSQTSSGANAEAPNSPLLFESDEDVVLLEDVPDSSASVTASSKDNNTILSLGTPLADLQTYPKDLPLMAELKASPHHTVLIKLPYPSPGSPSPGSPSPPPGPYRDKWDTDHVRMPCSPENLYPVENKNGSKSLENRWDVIETALRQGISSSLDLEEAILTYNTRYNQKWDFRGLHSFFTEVLEVEETVHFFNDTMPKMVELALELPQLCPQPVPMLKKTMSHSITLSQHQAASLLANAFFCTFPRRNTTKKQSEYSTYPDINFNRLFQGGKHPKSHRKAEKLKCIMNYFRRVTKEMPQGTLTFRRQCLRELPRWAKSGTSLRRLHVTATGTIEDQGTGMLQVDFANKYLGGGVLGFGCVQEEIRFLVCPELMLSRLFTEELDKNESLVMTGCEMFSTYSGYADSFRWAGDFVDTTLRDPWGRRCTEIVAIDALVIRSHSDQFQENLVRRELNKAYCGFHSAGINPQHLSAVATGNWGCGAFGGDLKLKALLQLMAASEAGRDVAYFTFQNLDLMSELHKIHSFLCSKQLAISDIYSLIQQYYDNVCRRSGRVRPPRTNLYEYVYRVYGDASDTESTDDQQSDDSREAAHWGRESPDYAANTP